jgi:flagellar hook protein FlgE
MISAISSSLSALKAFGKKLTVTADNIANVNTDGFKKSRCVFKEGPQGGVQANIQRIDAPGHPIREEMRGRISEKETSNVDLTEEIPQLILGRRGYQANVKAIQTKDEILGAIIDILR